SQHECHRGDTTLAHEMSPLYFGRTGLAALHARLPARTRDHNVKKSLWPRPLRDIRSPVPLAPRCEGRGRAGPAVGSMQSANCTRSFVLRILPVAPNGMDSTSCTSSGVHHLAILPS